MKEHRLNVPVRTEDLRDLAVGDVVYLDGVIYTGRESLYRHAVAEQRPLPKGLVEISNANFHCSPAASVNPDGSYNIGAVTATASFRFSRFIGTYLRLSGAKLIIGKGGMSEEDYRRDFVPNGAVYLTTVGYGTGALLGRGIRRVRAVHFLEEFGIAQAVWVLEVEKFGPLLVESDLAGNSLFEQANRETRAKVDAAYEGLRQPSLRRYGETVSRDDEVI